MAGAMCPSCKCMIGEEEHKKDCITRLEGEFIQENNPLPMFQPASSAEVSVLREHIAYLREQLEGKNRWQNTEIEKLRAERESVIEMRIALAVACNTLKCAAVAEKEDLIYWERLSRGTSANLQ